jgi:hypothetical protein
MYATVRRFEGVTNPGEAIHAVNEGIVPIVSQIPGFVAYYCVNAPGNVLVSTTVFQDKASADQANREVADYVLQNSMTVLPQPPQATAGEVVAYKTS